MKRSKKRRNYNVWRSPYKKAFKIAKEYAEEYGLDFPFSPVDNPTLEDIEDLREFHEEQVREEREKRKTNYYNKACEALDKIFNEAIADCNNDWELAKARHAEHEKEQAKQINSNDEEWGKYILSHVRELKEGLERFIFMSKQTWDINNPHESTEWWDAFEAVLMNW